MSNCLVQIQGFLKERYFDSPMAKELMMVRRHERGSAAQCPLLLAVLGKDLMMARDTSVVVQHSVLGKGLMAARH